MTDQTLCGLWYADDLDESGEWADDSLDDGELYGPDDEAYVAQPALGRTHPYGTGAV